MGKLTLVFWQKPEGLKRSEALDSPAPMRMAIALAIGATPIKKFGRCDRKFVTSCKNPNVEQGMSMQNFEVAMVESSTT